MKLTKQWLNLSMIAHNETDTSSEKVSQSERRLIEKRIQKLKRNTQPTIIRQTQSNNFPLSFAQEGLWFFENLTPRTPLYHVPLCFKLHGPLEISCLKKSIESLVQRHSSLRTSLQEESGEPVQFIHAATDHFLNAIFEFHSISTSEYDEWVQRATETPFDIINGPLLRFHVLRINPEEHILVITLHHLICDAWSIKLVLKELSHGYNHFLSGGNHFNFSETQIQFSDFAIWQRAEPDKPHWKNQLEYWIRDLKGIPEGTRFPVSCHEPVFKREFSGSQESLLLSPELSQKLKQLLEKQECTAFILFFAAFNTLLHRYTMEDEVIVGTPISERKFKETEDVIGLFVNTVVFRSKLEGNPIFSTYVQQLKEQFFIHYKYSSFPFEKIVQELHPSRTHLSNPIVRTVFAFEKESPTQLDLSHIKAVPQKLKSKTAKFDLLLSVVETHDGFDCNIEYNDQIYTAESVRQILRHYECLLQSVAEDSSQRLSEITILPPSEQKLILEEWNETRTDYPKDKSIHELFQEQVNANPDQIAIEAPPRKLTYRELNELSDSVAYGLIQENASGIIGICLARSPELIIGILGILKSNCAYTFVDLTQPAARIDHLLRSSNMKFVIGTKESIKRVREFNQSIAVLNIDDLVKCNKGNCKQSDAHCETEKSLAYVCFTSGSTGASKGVCISHQSVARLVKNTNFIEIKQSDIFLQLAPISFDACTFEIWGPLLNGAKLLIYPPETPSLRELGEFIQSNKVSVLWLTSGLFNQMVENQLKKLINVRYLISGGDALSVRHVQMAIDALGEGSVFNGYGPTESTTFACCHLIRKEDLLRISIPIGKPIANTSVYILDKYLQPVPIGVEGELYIGGDGIALGYLNEPDLTREKFIQNPFSTAMRDVLYRTGDRVRYLSNGIIEFLGRTDFQVKIRGFRIEPSEIEHALMEHPFVGETVVVPFYNKQGEKNLCAYYVRKHNLEANQYDLRGFLKDRLPEYMMPTHIVELEEFPLDANGKTDRKAFPHPLSHANNESKSIILPENRTQEILLSVWKSILGRNDIGIENGFFEVGGHSLLAIKLVSEIEKALGINVPVSRIFQFPTIRQLSSIINQNQVEYIPNSIVAIQSRGNLPPLFFIHGVGGGTFWGYQNLSAYLDREQPVYVFKSRGTDGYEEFETIEEMATHYLKDLKKFQPQGPYFLGGYCFGGNVAYEMARQLEAQGDDVGFLGIMNCIAPNSSYSKFRLNFHCLKNLITNLGYWIFQILCWGSKQRNEFFQWKLRNTMRSFTHIFRGSNSKVHQDEVVEKVVDLNQFTEEQKRLWKAHVKALMRHHPKPYHGKVTLFRSPGHKLLCSFQKSNGWSDFCPEVDVVDVPGAHETILLEPHVRALGNIFSSRLAIAQQKSNASPSQDIISTLGIHHLFESQVNRKPDAAAIRHKGKIISYKELDQKANLVAVYLKQKHVKADDLIGVFMERSPEMIISILAILKAGAGYVPLDPKYPKERIQYLIEDANPKFILTQSPLRTQIAGFKYLVEVTALLKKDKPQDSHSISNNFSDNQLAYVIYTSGSTGQPKGVAVEHRSVVHFLKWARKVYTDEEISGAVFSTSICFDVSVFELFVPLSWGGTIHLTENILHVADMTEKENIRMLNLVPSAARELLNQGTIPPTVTTLNLAGEALSSDLVDQLYKLPHIQKVYDLYGPTETTVYSTYALRKPNTKATIGSPLTGEIIYILDENHNPVPTGESGELYIAGIGLARGYLNKSALTNERFLPNPFSNNPGHGSRMYRTGDLASFNPDGSIQYMGRIDQQVKIRGFRIELGEIESALKTYDTVADAVVVATGSSEHKQLSAFIISKEASNSMVHLKAFLGKKLPTHMVPAFITELKEFPVTPNGKIDRKKLQNYELEVSNQPDEFTQIDPNNKIEQRLSEIFKNLLKIKKVSPAESFFDLGGHSLLAVRLFSEIEIAFNKKLPITTLIENPTIQTLAKKIHDNVVSDYKLIVPLQAEGKKAPFFWIHSLGGDGGGGFFYYRKLVENLKVDQPSFGIRSPKTPFDSIETMALHYAAEIKRFWPSGPYYLGGFCFGGNVAFEVARKLSQDGARIAFLGLFESEVVNAEVKYFSSSAFRSVASNLYIRCGRVLKNHPIENIRGLKKRCMKVQKTLRYAFSNSEKRLDRKFERAIDVSSYPEDYLEFASAHWKALHEYIPQPYDGDVHLMKAKSRSIFSVDPTLGWSSITRGKLIIKDVSGTHESMFQEPNVTELASYLRQRLEETYRGEK